MVRMNYNRVNGEQNESTSLTSSPPSSSASGSNSSRSGNLTNHGTVSIGWRNNDSESNSLNAPLALHDHHDAVQAQESTTISVSSSPPETKSKKSSTKSEKKDLLPKIEKLLKVVILDPAQNKFEVPVDAGWTVQQLKDAGCVVHKVQPPSQRLIYMGRLLQDSKSLQESGIVEDGVIVHLFPKPNVVVTNASANDTTSAQDTAHDNTSSNNTTTAAHIPQIILDAEEVERRSQILVLSSHEIFEAQHRVKLLSFVLIVYCSMELLTLLTMFVGGGTTSGTDSSTGWGGGGGGGFTPPDPTDTSPHGNGTTGMDRTWHNYDYFDLVVSSAGFYVATLGIKATTVNTVQLAKTYFYALICVGLAWNALYFVTNVERMEDAAQGSNSNNDSDNDTDSGSGVDKDVIYSTAASNLILPGFLWMTCFLRAYQFQTLLEEAERETLERNRGVENINNDEETGNGNDGSTRETYDLELQADEENARVLT